MVLRVASWKNVYQASCHMLQLLQARRVVYIRTLPYSTSLVSGIMHIEYVYHTHAQIPIYVAVLIDRFTWEKTTR